MARKLRIHARYKISTVPQIEVMLRQVPEALGLDADTYLDQYIKGIVGDIHRSQHTIRREKDLIDKAQLCFENAIAVARRRCKSSQVADIQEKYYRDIIGQPYV